jgi:hypothetical protein
MKQVILKTNPVTVMLALGMAAGIFVVDLYVPDGIAVGMLYVAPVVLTAMWSLPTHHSVVIITAILCNTLIILGVSYPWTTPLEAPLAGYALGNHGLAIGAVWATVALSLLRKRTEQKARWIDLLPRL